MRIVLYTNVMVSALLSPTGPPARVLGMVVEGKASVLLDQRILTEYQRVLARPKFEFEASERDALLEFLGDKGEDIAHWKAVVALPHRHDAKFLKIAIAGRADAPVTGNLRHFPVAARQGIRVLLPAEFVAALAR